MPHPVYRDPTGAVLAEVVFCDLGTPRVHFIGEQPAGRVLISRRWWRTQTPAERLQRLRAGLFGEVHGGPPLSIEKRGRAPRTRPTGTPTRGPGGACLMPGGRRSPRSTPN